MSSDRKRHMLRYEKRLHDRGIHLIAGVDEAGRGPLAGPVVAAAVIFSPGIWIDGVDDSKKLTACRREECFALITEHALSIGVSVVSHTVIDEINILEASMCAMADAVSRLAPQPEHLLIDGPIYRSTLYPFTPIIEGDALSFTIAAASIVAKVIRDRLMLEYDREFPMYGFARHKGYGTPEHLSALQIHGPCTIHRRSFRLTGPRRENGNNEQEHPEH